MVKDISSSIGVFDMPPEDKEFMDRFVKEAIYDDYDYLVQLCDALALPTGFCLLEKRFVDVAIRYGYIQQLLNAGKQCWESRSILKKRWALNL